MAYTWGEWSSEYFRWFGNGVPWKSRWAEDLVWSKQNRDNLRQYANEATANLVLLGPVAAGKSSFFNTASSAVAGVLKAGAATRGNAESVTSRIRRYRVEFGNVDVCDTIGISPSEGIDEGVEQLLLDGMMPRNECSEGLSRKHDDIDGAVIVVDAKAVRTVPTVPNIKRSVTKMQEAFEAKDIPYIMVLTKIDMVDKKLFGSVKNVFFNKEVYKSVKLAEDCFGVPKNRIWPILNYEENRTNRDDIDILALSAMEMILRFATDHMRRRDRCI